MFVEVRGEGDRALALALAEFKRKVKKNEILLDYRKSEYFVKPSERRKLKKAEAFKRQRREENARRRKDKRNRS